MMTHRIDQPEFAGKAPAPPRRRWLVIGGFGAWTVLAAILVASLLGESAKSGEMVFHFGPDDQKTWTERLQQMLVLGRLNFSWGLPWLLLAPYTLWLGARFHFEAGRWRTRLPALALLGAGFIGGSQWLGKLVGPSRNTMVVFRYSAEAHGRVGEIGAKFLGDTIGDTNFLFGLTNRLGTNIHRRIVVSGETHGSVLGGEGRVEVTESEVIAGLGSNLPPVLAEHLPPPLPRRFGPHFGAGSVALDALACLALLGLSHAGAFHQRYRERERQASLLEARLNQARLRALQGQLQPHFLFNALNGIATLVRRDPVTAEEMLIALSDLLRAVLSNSQQQEITLRQELDFIHRYLALQKMRFGTRLDVQLDIDPNAMDCLVPALLLQPLVENAIRHGLEPLATTGILRIATSRSENELVLKVADNGVGLPDTPGARTGFGLANVRERLAALYGKNFQFEVLPRETGGVLVQVRLPVRLAAAAEAESAVS